MKTIFKKIPFALVIAVALSLVTVVAVFAWPIGWKEGENNCKCAAAESTIAIGTRYQSGSHWYYLHDVTGDGECKAYNASGKASGTLAFIWKRVTGNGTFTEYKNWEISRPAYCTDCANKIDGTPIVSLWVYSPDGHTRTRTISTPTFDADWPQKSCGIRTETEEQKAKEFCYNNKTEWYFPGEVPAGAVEGPCAACQVFGDVLPLPDWGDPVYSNGGHTRTFTRVINLADPDGNPCGTRTEIKTENATPYCVNDETIWVWPDENAPDINPGACPADIEGEPDYKLECVIQEDGSVGIRLTLILPEGVIMYGTPGGTINETTSFIVAPGAYDFPWDTEKGYKGSGVLHVVAVSCETGDNWKPVCPVYPCPVCQYENTRGSGVDCLGPNLYGTEDVKPAVARVINDCIAEKVCTKSEWWVVAWAEGEKGLEGIHDGAPDGPFFKAETNTEAGDENVWQLLMYEVGMPRLVKDNQGVLQPNLMSFNDRLYPVIDGKILAPDEFYQYEPCSLSLSFAMTKIKDGKFNIMKMPGTDQWSYATFLVKAGKAPMPDNWYDWNTGVLGKINQWYTDYVIPAKIGDLIEVPDFNQ